MAVKIHSSHLLNQSELSHHIKVFAGPGAGKTHFLVENIKNIIKNNSIINKSLQKKILCITYTNTAVDEIENRLNKYKQDVEVVTIHKFIIDNIIVPFQDDLKEIMNLDFNIKINTSKKITSQIDGLNILHGYQKEAIEEYVSKKLNKDVTFEFGKKTISDIQINIGLFNNEEKTELYYNANKINEEYVKILKEFMWLIVRKLTHDEILYFGYRILKHNSTALYALRVKFPFIFIDEFQDTNPLQTSIIKLIGEKNTKIIVIGDIAQSIYSFQGATPTQFQELTTINEENIEEYVIEGNRRSTNNIVQICNYIRKSDQNVFQISEKNYINEIEKEKIESIAVKFLFGKSKNVEDKIQEVINSGGRVLTRQWAYAFEYMQGISNEQKKKLKAIYNSYYATSIDIRKDIVEHSYVTWVRAFKFIIHLYKSYKTGSFNEIINALNLYFKISLIKSNGVKPKEILELKLILDNIFSEIQPNTKITETIHNFNLKIKTNTIIKNLFDKLGNENFEIIYITEYDGETFQDNLKQIEWLTANNLFSEVFSQDSIYMTVHQAKGLEWNKVIVALVPSRDDKTSLKDFWTTPQVLNENPADEFSRIYYVACSRACQELYIHIESEQLLSEIKNNLDNYISNSRCHLKYEIIK